MSVSGAWLVGVGADGRAHRPVTLASGAGVPVLDPDVLTDVREAIDPLWDVIVWDDPVNLMSYVVLVLRRVFGYEPAIARRLMLQVHNEGRATVATETREVAEFHVAQLHGHGLNATMERTA